jgi:hypothetical protein
VKYRQGMKLNYVTQTSVAMPANTTNAPGKPTTIAEPFTGIVTAIQNGVATLQVTLGPSSMNGQTHGTARNFVLQVDEHARPVGAPVSGLEFLLPNLPDKVKVGQTFTRKQSGTLMQIPVTIHAEYRFLGVKPAHGQSSALFHVTLKGTGSLPGGQMSSASFQTQGEGTMELAVADGLITHVSIDQTAVLAQGSQPFRVKVKSLIDRK